MLATICITKLNTWVDFWAHWSSIKCFIFLVEENSNDFLSQILRVILVDIERISALVNGQTLIKLSLRDKAQLASDKLFVINCSNIFQI